MNKTLQNIFIIGGTVLAMYVGYFLADGWFSAKYETPTAYRDTTPAEIVKPKISQEFIDSFMEGCDPNGTQRSFCQCGLNYLVDMYGVDGTIVMGNKYANTGVIPQGMIDATEHCLTVQTR